MFDQFVDDARNLLASLDQDVDDAERIDRIRALEQFSATIAAAMAREVVAFLASQRATQAARGLPAERIGLGIAAQIGLARRISPFAASRYLTKVQTLLADLPETLALLRAGQVPEYRALLVAKEVAWLTPEHRHSVDEQLAPTLPRLGTKRLIDTVKKIAYRLDPHGYLARLDIAETERSVTIRPAADGMARLSLLVPLTQGVAAYAALRAHAMTRRGIGEEPRTLAQLMADTAIERITGQHQAHDVPIEINLIMTDQTLLNSGPGKDEPATIINGGIIPAHLAREVLDRSTTTWLRRLYADPAGKLAGMETRRRLFTTAQRTMLILRDQTCRNPWCEAPIRHADHITPHHDSGPTSIDNGQGLCETCNHTKQAPGWTQHRHGNQIITTTPTGHTYTSDEPPLIDRTAA